MDTRLMTLLPLFVAIGCTGGQPPDDAAPGVDTDQDGLDDAKEASLGSDPSNPDSHGDGLADGDEVDNGADPTVVDTDGDTYTDRDEVFEGTDPADPESVIYRGGWPYYFDKEELKAGDP